MADNPTKIYNDFVRANLPIGMSYDLNTNRYDINNLSFFKFKNSNWYYKYISKYGYSAGSAYYVNGFEPSLVLDFQQDYYRTDGTASTFSDAVTHSRTGNATMVDADGLLKWAPHNLVPDSTGWVGISGSYTTGTSDPDGGSDAITATNTLIVENVSNLTVGVVHTFQSVIKAGTATTIVVGGNITGSNLYVVVDLLTNSITSTPSGYTASVADYGPDGWKIVTWSASPSSTSRNIYFARCDGVAGADSGTLDVYATRAYRSDLGGMVNNPDRGDSYVPTTTVARYLPRRGHHIYNGTSWVNEGLLHESDARTNLQPFSTILDAEYSKTGTTITENAAASPDGITNASRITPKATTGSHFVFDANSFVPDGSSKYCGSVYVKADGYDNAILGFNTAGFPASASCYFNLSTGAVGSSGNGIDDALIEDVGDGWYRCSIVSTSDATAGSGLQIFAAETDGVS